LPKTKRILASVPDPTEDIHIPETSEELAALTGEEAIAAAKAAEDRDFAEAMAARFAREANQQPKTTSVVESFNSLLDTVIAGAKRTRTPLPTAVKVMELNLMWVLNTRHDSMNIPTETVESPESDLLPVPNEVITEDTDA
jgi:hypothetical protein